VNENYDKYRNKVYDFLSNELDKILSKSNIDDRDRFIIYLYHLDIQIKTIKLDLEHIIITNGLR
jgi:hypothetical protein